MKRHPPGFHSPFASLIEGYLQVKRALNRRFDNEEVGLRLFDQYLVEQGITEIGAVTSQVIEAFLASRPISRPKSYNHLAGVLRRWLGWVAQQGEITAVPICPSPRRITSERLPFIFDPPLAKRLLALTSELHDTDRARARPATYRMIFALLYGLGLRVGEVTRLNVQDIDFRHDLLIIRSSKFDKSRLVPFGPKMALELQGYLQTRQTLRTDMQPDSPLFSFSQKSKPITKSPITQAFHQILPKLELNIPPGAATPRLHDLRHNSGSRIIPHSDLRGPKYLENLAVKDTDDSALSEVLQEGHQAIIVAVARCADIGW
jgi:site-specific recombinase XerD